MTNLEAHYHTMLQLIDVLLQWCDDDKDNKIEAMVNLVKGIEVLAKVIKKLEQGE